MRLLVMALCFVLGASAAAMSDERCLIVGDLRSGTELFREGSLCEERIGPASSFKFALAVMGYDAGILTDAETPAWPYRERYEAVRAIDRQTVTPASWMRESVLWYSREIVAALGAERFAGYVAGLGYGNADVSGDPGAGNGMTHSWLNTSLLISPLEQMHFVRRVALGSLPVSDDATRRALAILPVFPAGDGWSLFGKTGTGYVRESNGRLGRRQFGWFIGLGVHADGRSVVFAALRRNSSPGGNALGPRLRDEVVARWPAVMAGLN